MRRRHSGGTLAFGVGGLEEVRMDLEGMRRTRAVEAVRIAWTGMIVGYCCGCTLISIQAMG